MFTGIITYMGKLRDKKESLYTFKTSRSFCRKLEKGVSIAVNGACLTVVGKIADDSFGIEVMPETASRTMLGKLKKDDPVNLELPVTPQTLLSGHIIQGHVDGLGKLTETAKNGNSHILKFSIPKGLSKYIVSKGSIAINGISLTVIDASKSYFTVGIIPYTWGNTILHVLKLGDLVNVEVDVLAKYVEKLLHT